MKVVRPPSLSNAIQVRHSKHPECHNRVDHEVGHCTTYLAARDQENVPYLCSVLHVQKIGNDIQNNPVGPIAFFSLYSWPIG
jgi:hypothetical protein